MNFSETHISEVGIPSVEERIARAREMLETPFLHLGRDHNGIDCVGLLTYAMGYPEALVPVYPRDPFRGALEYQLDAIFGPPCCTAGRAGVAPGTVVAGDVVAMAYSLRIRHVAIIAQHPTYPEHLSVIHTDSTVGKVTEHILDDNWLRLIKRVYRV